MALTFIDRTPTDKTPKGGSNLLQFLLTKEQAEKAWRVDSEDPLAVAGWHRPFRHMTGGTINFNPTIEEVEDETGALVAEIETDNEITIANGSTDSSPDIHHFIEWLKENPVPCRYFLPTKADGTFRVEDGGRIGDLIAFPSAKARKISVTLNVGNNQQRSHPFEIIALKNEETGRYYEYERVNLDDDTAWPPNVSFAKDPA